jgi:hypothetical protein
MNRRRLAEIMNQLTEVKWDRCTGVGGRAGSVFGWIERPDGRADFIVVGWLGGKVWYTTSSAEFSREFSRRLVGTDKDHRDCERVEDVFGGDVTRKVILAEGRAA